MLSSVEFSVTFRPHKSPSAAVMFALMLNVWFLRNRNCAGVTVAASPLPKDTLNVVVFVALLLGFSVSA